MRFIRPLLLLLAAVGVIIWQMPISALALTEQRITIRAGDTLDALFEHHKIGAMTFDAVTTPSIAKTILAQLQPGHTLTLRFDSQHRLEGLRYRINSESDLVLHKTAAGFNAVVNNKPVTSKLAYRSGVVRHSLAEATLQAGMTLPLYKQFNQIFAGTLNMKQDLKRGDHFDILYKEYYVDGKKDHAGNIVLASLTHHGKTHKAIYFTYPKNHSGYYTPDGHGIQPRFLTAPLHYKRISSYFTYRRYDPYLHIMHPHLGIDFAARQGTPIKAIGDGKVIFAGRDHGYGNAVVIRYGPKYKTLYGHMAHFAKGIHAGKRVHKGEVVGYVGSTGWSTGPHLHFEVYVYGKPTNPLKLHFPNGRSIPKSYHQQFLAAAKALQHIESTDYAQQ